MSKVNYDSFSSFDLNEACDFFDSEKQSNWKKIGKFIVADEQEYTSIMEKEFDYDEVGSGEYEAFMRGVQYALTRMNIALDAADLPLEVAQVDLVEGYGYMLVRTDDTPESFVKRVFKKPVLMVESWVD
jgi:hypothetical protein